MDDTILSTVRRARFDAHDLLRDVPAKGLAKVNKVLAKLFGSRSVFSTVYDGPRQEHVASDDDLADRMSMLAEALNQDQLIIDPLARDLYGPEPRPLAFIRQLEGHAPALPGVLAAGMAANHTEVVREAMAAGFVLGAPDPTGEMAALGLMPPNWAKVQDSKEGNIKAGAAASWSRIAAIAKPIGLTTALGLRDVFFTPIEAVSAGVFYQPNIDRRYNRSWSASFQMAPDGVGVTERTWVFADMSVAEAVLEGLARRYRPLWMETIPSIDTQIMAAAGLWKQRRRFKSLSSGALRVVFAGSPAVRRASLLEASWGIERAGGVCHFRRPPASAPLLSAIAVAAGAARLVRPTSATMPVPEGTVSQTKHTAVHGNVRAARVLWYPRDLKRSLQQAQQALGLAVSPLKEDAESDTDHSAMSNEPEQALA